MNAESVSFFCVYEEENYVIKYFADSYFRDVYGMMQGEGASILKFVNIPISIFLGIAIGLLIGVLLAYFFKKMHIRDTSKVLIILSISFLLVVMEDKLSTPITFSALIAIMFIGIGLQKKRETVAKRLSVKYGKLWVAAEVFLFVLVGATVNIGYLGKVGVKALIVIIGALVFRMFGVFVCLLGTSLKRKAVYDAGIYTESNCPGCNWGDSACIRFYLWRSGTYSGGSCDSTYGTVGGICHRFVV